MAYTRVTSTRGGRAAIKYVLEEQKKNPEIPRVLMKSGVNLNPDMAMEQMESTWAYHGKDDGRVAQVYRVVMSYGSHELDPEKPEDVELANQMGVETATELYPDRQVLVVTQADGKGGKLHNHLIVNSVSFVDGKSLRGEGSRWSGIAKKSDEILVRHGMEPITKDVSRKNPKSAQYWLGERDDYSWLTDLEERIETVANHPDITSREAFAERLMDDYDVDVKYKDTRGNKGNKMRQGSSYAFVDADDKKRTARASKLDDVYSTRRMDERFAENLARQQQQIADDLAQKEADEAAAEQKRQDAAEKAKADAEAAKAKPKSTEDIMAMLTSDIKTLGAKRKSFSSPAVTQSVPVVSEPVVPVVSEELLAERAAERADAEQKRQDAMKAEERAAAAREEAERKAEQAEQKKAAEDARKAIEVLEEAKRQEQAEKAQKLREEAKGRLVGEVFHGWKENYDVPESTLTRFMQNEEKWMGTKFKNGITKELKDYTVPEVYRRTKIQLSNEKRAEQNGTQQAEQVGEREL